jgi:hypothetical protein
MASTAIKIAFCNKKTNMIIAVISIIGRRFPPKFKYLSVKTSLRIPNFYCWNIQIRSPAVGSGWSYMCSKWETPAGGGIHNCCCHQGKFPALENTNSYLTLFFLHSLGFSTVKFRSFEHLYFRLFENTVAITIR